MSSKDSGGKGGGNETIITDSNSTLYKPLNLLSAVSEIQRMSAQERDLSLVLSEDYFPIQSRIDFFTVGVRNALMHLIFGILVTPLTIGVIHNLIPLFGENKATPFNQVYAIFLSLSISLGYGFFLMSLRKSYVGTVSKSMIRNLLGGLAVGEVFKTFIAILIYQIIYIEMTPEHIYSFITFLNKYLGHILVKFNVNYEKLFLWILNFRNVFPLSSVLVFISALLMVGLPTVAIAITAWRSRKRDDVM